MSDRRLRHDGVDPDPTHAPGPARRLDPATLRPLDEVGVRRNVTSEETKKKRRNVRARAATMTFAKQKKAIEMANATLLERIALAIEDGTEDADTITALARCASITKQFLVEERAGPDPNIDPAKLSTEELRKAAK